MQPQKQDLRHYIRVLNKTDEDLDFEIYSFVEDTLVAHKDEALPILLKTLQENKGRTGKEFLLARSLNILAAMNDERAIQPIYEFTQNDPAQWRVNGGVALSRLGDSRSLIFLLPELLDIYIYKSVLYRYQAPCIYSALEKLGDKRLLPALYWFLYQEGDFPIDKNVHYAVLDGSGLSDVIQTLEKEETKRPVQYISSEPFLSALTNESVVRRRGAMLILACLLTKKELKMLFSQLVSSDDPVIHSVADFTLRNITT